MTRIPCPICTTTVPATTCYHPNGLLLNCPGCCLITCTPEAYRLARSLSSEIRARLAAESRDRYENEGCPHLVLHAAEGVTLREGTGEWHYGSGKLPRALLAEMGLLPMT